MEDTQTMVESDNGLVIHQFDSVRHYELLIEYVQLKNAGGLIPEGMYLTPQAGSLGGTNYIDQILPDNNNAMVITVEFKGYPHEIPTIHLHNRLPHPLLGSDQLLNISAFLQGDSRMSISKVLKAIERAFSHEGLKSLKSEQCVNLAIKHQINFHFDSYLLTLQEYLEEDRNTKIIPNL